MEQIEAVERLEVLVRRAGEELRDLREKNQSLLEEVERLQRDRDASTSDQQDWESQREEIGKRLDQMTEGLESLLAVAES